jgi:signal transduction histidine kinase
MPSQSKKRSRRTSVERTVDSVIVHDMKNLAFRLSTLLQNMEDNYENPLFKKSMLDVLGDTIRKMNDIVLRFRDQQQHVMVKVRVNIKQVLSSLLDELPPRMTKNLDVHVELDDLPEIWGDPYYLRNAFHSLIENATDAMPNSGVLTVTTRVQRRRKRPAAIVEICDTGIGMSQAFMENKLFRPFITTKEQGLGLGLYTCQQIFALHHAKIEVESAPNQGTTFRIILPIEVHEAHA